MNTIIYSILARTCVTDPAGLKVTSGDLGSWSYSTKQLPCNSNSSISAAAIFGGPNKDAVANAICEWDGHDARTREPSVNNILEHPSAFS